MLGSVTDLVLINAFWLSLMFIGYMSLLFCRDRFAKDGHVSKIIRAVLSQHAFIIVFISFLLVVGLFAILSIPLYLTQAPVYIPKVIYVTLALSAFMYAAYLLVLNILSTKQYDVFKLKGQPLYVRAVFLVLVIGLKMVLI